MPLISLKTNLKNLKFGKDRPYGGSSNQPYIKFPIPEGDLPINPGPDFLLRGGFLAPLNAGLDVSRLAQMFFDIKSPNGFLFIGKQNQLSRTAVRTEATKGIGYAGGKINGGLYLPSSTLAQAAVGFTGTHLNLLGIDPTSPMSGVTERTPILNLGLNRYEDVVRINNNSENSKDNRLVDLTNAKININTQGKANILNYDGGPGSILGIGKTTIPFADKQRTGRNNIELINTKFFSTENSGYYNYSIFKNPRQVNLQGSRIFNGNNVSAKYEDLTGINALQDSFKTSNDQGPLQLFSTNVYKSGTLDTDPTLPQNSGVYTLSQQQIISKPNLTEESNKRGNIREDFRREIITSGDIQSSTVLSLSPSYNSAKRIEDRVNLGDPGQPRNVFNYAIPANQLEALDKITAMPMYEGAGPNGKLAINDLVKFRIAILNNNKSDESATYLHFRAFIDSFSDAYNSSWNAINYVGRGEPLFNYGGNFTRRINMSFTVAAQSKAELIPMYKKLNYLASSLAPDYNEAGFMRGSLARLTVGGYVYEQYGFIESFTYDIPAESTWEIGIDNEGNSDNSVKELPHMIKVTGFSFVPIHKFLPRKATNANFADQRYIALTQTTDTTKTNYSDSYPTYPS